MAREAEGADHTLTGEGPRVKSLLTQSTSLSRENPGFIERARLSRSTGDSSGHP